MTEAHDLWTRRAPASFKDRVPQVAQVDGAAHVGRQTARSSAGPAPAASSTSTARRAARSKGSTSGRSSRRTPRRTTRSRAWSCSTRSASGRRSSSPASSGSAARASASIVQDVALRNVCLEIFNDANAEIQAESGNRLLPMAILPAWDIDACVREAQRAKSLGLRGVNLTSDPQDLGSPDLANRAWDPVWDACSALELPVHFHIGASLTTMNFFGTYPWDSHDDDTKLAIGGTLLFIGNARVVVNIICSGMLDRFPELKIVSVESGTGWVPFILEALDYEMEENAPQAKAALSLLAVGVLQAPDLRHDVVRAPQPRGRSIAVGRRGQHHVRDRLPAPDVPVPGSAEDRRRTTWPSSARRCSGRSSARTPPKLYGAEANLRPFTG